MSQSDEIKKIEGKIEALTEFRTLLSDGPFSGVYLMNELDARLAILQARRGTTEASYKWIEDWLDGKD